MIKEALDNCGGAEYLVAQSEKNPSAFMALIGKIIPNDVEVQIAKSAWEAIEDTENANGNPTTPEV